MLDLDNQFLGHLEEWFMFHISWEVHSYVVLGYVIISINKNQIPQIRF